MCESSLWKQGLLRVNCGGREGGKVGHRGERGEKKEEEGEKEEEVV